MISTLHSYRRLSYLIVFAAAISSYSSAHAVPVLWVDNDHLYDVITSEDILWDTASADALALGPGWDLASITSQAEQDFITSLLPIFANNRDHYWIGGTDAGNEGTWTWLDGESWGYENWYAGEDNNVHGGEHFLAMDFRVGVWAGIDFGAGAWAGWNDASDFSASGMVRGYIAERVSVPEPGSLALLVTGLLWLTFAKPGDPRARVTCTGGKRDLAEPRHPASQVRPGPQDSSPDQRTPAMPFAAIACPRTSGERIRSRWRSK